MDGVSGGYAKDFLKIKEIIIKKTSLKNEIKENAEPGGSLDAKNVCGLTGKFLGGASDLDRWPVDYCMKNIKIVDYENKMKSLVRTLFCSIYTDLPGMAGKMSYDNLIPNHITTQVAFEGELIIGQANIFLKNELAGKANLGFHVHPEKRKHGVAKALSRKAITVATSKGISEIYIRTHKDNKAAIAVANSLGFIREGSRIPDKEITVYRKTLL